MAYLRRVLGSGLSVLLLAGGLAATAAGASVAVGTDPPPPPGGFTAVAPIRILDTRTGTGAPAGKVGPGQALQLQVTGAGGVPSTGVAAVALNVTVTEPSAVGFLTVYPTGEAQPLASSANFVPGQTAANAVVVKVGTGGRVTIFNSSGATHVVADVAGWHATGRDTGSAYTPVTPVRLLDTRSGTALGPGGVVSLKVTDGRPANLSAVALNVTATQPSTGGFLTLYPSGGSRPLASSLNVAAGQTRPNFVAVKVGNGSVDIYNNSGTTHVVVDLLGYWSPTSESRMVGITPTRVMDTRTGLGHTGALGRQETAVLQLPGPSSVPAGRLTAVVLNVTATQPTTGGYLTVFPGGGKPPLASNLNVVAGETAPNLVIVPVSPNDTIGIYNDNGSTHVVVDVVGWFDFPAERVDVQGLSMFGSDVAIDPTSTYAYVSNTAHDRVEVVRLADRFVEDPIPVGVQPMGLDLSPDGRMLYVANRGSEFVSVIDVRTRTEVHRIPIPSGRLSDRPYSIAVLANGKALLTTTFDGSGYGAFMYDIDLATETVKLRTDFDKWSGQTSEYTSIRASGDRTAAVITLGDSSPGEVFRYDASTDIFSAPHETWDFISAAATNVDGTVTLVNDEGTVVDGNPVLDEHLDPLGTLYGCGLSGVAVNRDGTVGYGLGYNFSSGRGYIAVCDLARFEVTKVIVLGSVRDLGRLVMSPDQKTLVGLVDSGLVLVRL
ncbi:MAG: hypothetical protein V7605_1038 [Acidimicrobiaceae bacterium]